MMFSVILQFVILRISLAITEEEYCTGEFFDPKCDPDEIVIMHSALYGRMAVGRCLPTDLGYMGCQSDVLAQFDEECSGKHSCSLQVLDTSIKFSGGCLKGLSSYLKVSYECKKGMNLPSQCSGAHTSSVEISSEVFISSDILETSCYSRSRVLTLRAKQGQVLNVSMVDLQHKNTQGSVYGSLTESKSSKRVVFGAGSRQQQLMLSTSSSVDVVMQSSAQNTPRFLLRVAVKGCPNISPPNAGWMTRQGDAMELGCHRGGKSWTLRCENNQWIGAVGQCGSSSSSRKTDDIAIKDKNVGGVSPNVALFGISSFVILLSAIIFLAGVCILKRKIQEQKSHTVAEEPTYFPAVQPENMGNPTIPRQNYPSGATVGNNPKDGYKLLPVSDTQDNDKFANIRNTTSPPAYSLYANGGASHASESVKYYTLEDFSKS